MFILTIIVILSIYIYNIYNNNGRHNDSKSILPGFVWRQKKRLTSSSERWPKRTMLTARGFLAMLTLEAVAKICENDGFHDTNMMEHAIHLSFFSSSYYFQHQKSSFPVGKPSERSVLAVAGAQRFCPAWVAGLRVRATPAPRARKADMVVALKRQWWVDMFGWSMTTWLVVWNLWIIMVNDG